ncbi:PAS domain-containing protein, partial [Escherichia coli]|uniref:PAS domain-containing protein n=1 Tax=Escherichia coli TaxID=562 RepID=UPI00211470A3
MTTPSPNIAFHDLVDTLRSAVVVLDSSLRVTSANQPFYRLFQVEAGATENRILFDLGDGHWEIP